MLTISGVTAIAERAIKKYKDLDYLVKTKKRERSVFQFRNQDYESIKKWLQEGHYSFRDNAILTEDNNIIWVPIEKPQQQQQQQQPVDNPVEPQPPPTFFNDPIENVRQYTFRPGRYASHLFVSALACIAQHRPLLQRVVPLRCEQNCTDIYEMPGKEDEDEDEIESLSDGEYERQQALEGEEGGQFSSYQSCTDGETIYAQERPRYLRQQDDEEADGDGCAEKEVVDDGPKSYGLFSSHYKEKKNSYKLGIWDSDNYSSSEEGPTGQCEQTANPQQSDYSQQQHQSGDCDYENDDVHETPSPSGQSPIPSENAGPVLVNKFAGVFRFRLWSNGQWVEVVVDEMLPYSEEGELLSTTCFDGTGQPVRDLWLPLLEKAYAKLLGRYECLSSASGGCLEDFLTDLSGGICESIQLRTSNHRNDFGLQASLGHRMHTELYNGRGKKMAGGKYPGFYSLLMALEEPYNSRMGGQTTEHGIVLGRAYPVTDVKEIAFAEVEAFAPNNHTLLMVRLRDPFGPASWNGPFSRGSPEWLAISPIERFKIGLICETEGDFWMPIDQFCARFTQVTFCRIVNTNLFTVRRHYWDNTIEGSWRAAVRMAGGSFDNNRETFLRNPQYLFRIEPHHTEVMISLSQQLIRQDPSQERHSIGFTILHVEENRVYRVHHIPTPEAGFSPIVLTTQYRHTGHVFAKLLLYHGRYVVIPTTNETFKNGNFLLRLICPHQCYLRHMNQDIPAMHPLLRYPMCVTRVRVIRASSLCRLDRPTGPINAYCVIWCERHWVRTKTLWHNSDPEWNQSAIFYRRWSATMCIKVAIWHQAPKLWRDQYLGKHIFQAYEETGRPITVSLYGRRRWEHNQPRSGVLTVEITSSPDLGAL